MKKFVRFMLCAVVAGALWDGFGATKASLVLGERKLNSGATAAESYWTYPDLTIVNKDGTTFKSIMLSLTKTPVDNDEIIVPADDAKFFRPNSITDTKAAKTRTIASGVTLDEIRDYLRKVKFKTLANESGQRVKIVVTTEEISDQTFYCETTRHYYQYVTGAVDWKSAFSAARQKKFMGRQGYLATIMSKEEDLVARKMSDKTGWLGGTSMKAKGGSVYEGGGSLAYFTDWEYTKTGTQTNPSDFPAGLDVLGWYWACGPECGDYFFLALMVVPNSSSPKTWNGITIPTFSDATQKSQSRGWYSNWDSRTPEPNYPHVEPWLQTLTSGHGYATDTDKYSWNDHSGANGYFVEYGNQRVGDTNENNPPDEWAVAGDDVPSTYKVFYYKDATTSVQTDTLAYGVKSDLRTRASLSVVPPDTTHTNFFGWATSAGASIPALLDGQTIQNYVTVGSDLTLYPVWTDKPVVTGKLMTRAEAELFQLKVVDFDRQPLATAVTADGGGDGANLVWYAFSAEKGAYGLDVLQRKDGAQAWITLVRVETAGTMVGPDVSTARIWDIEVESGDKVNADKLAGRIKQARGNSGARKHLASDIPALEMLRGAQWLQTTLQNAYAPTATVTVNSPKSYLNVESADGTITTKMKAAWPELASAKSVNFARLRAYACGYLRRSSDGGVHTTWLWTQPVDDISGLMTESTDFVDAAVQMECRRTTADLPWRVYRYSKDSTGEHYDRITQTANSAGEKLIVCDGYVVVHVKQVGQLAFIDPTVVELDPGSQHKTVESTWAWTNMTWYGYMKYDRVDLELHNVGEPTADKFVEPTTPSGWNKQSSSTAQHLVYRDTSGYGASTFFGNIVTNILEKVRLNLSTNPDETYWRVKLTRADGFKPFELDIGVSNAWYAVDYRPTIPDAGNAQTLVYKNVRVIEPPLAAENLGFGAEGCNFYCWTRGGVPFLDDGQPFFDISKAFQTNVLAAKWVETPVLYGECPTNLNGNVSVKLVSVGETNSVPGDVLYAGAAPGRYVTTAAPGLYDVVYTDKDKLPHTELTMIESGRMSGPSFVGDRISTGVNNGNAETGFKLLAGALRSYDGPVYEVCSNYFHGGVMDPHYDHFSTPRFDLESAKVTSEEKTSLAESLPVSQSQGTTFFAVRARMQMTFLSSTDPTYYWLWNTSAADPAKLGKEGYYLGTNLLVALVVPFKTAAFADCRDGWQVARRNDDASIDLLTSTPNAKGEAVAVGDGYLLLTVEKFGAFGIHAPDLTTVINLGTSTYTNEYGVSFFEHAAGSGDRLYDSIAIELTHFDADAAEVGLARWATNGVERLTNSTDSVLKVRFTEPKTAAEIADFIAKCVWIESDYSYVGVDVTVKCFQTDDASGEAAYTSPTSHIVTRAAVVKCVPGAGGFAAEKDNQVFVCPSNITQIIPPARLFFALGLWETNNAAAVNRYPYGWRLNEGAEVRFGELQHVLNQFRLGETNILTAVWTNMPVIAGDVAVDSYAGVVVWSLTNTLQAAIFEGGAEMNRYAQPMPAGRPYNVAVEYGTSDGEVKSIETVLVTNDVETGATYDSTGRVVTTTCVLPPPATDTDFVLVGGLQSVTGAFPRVEAMGCHLTSGDTYVAFTNAVGTKEGTYFDLALWTNDAAVAISPVPLTVLLPFDSDDILDSTNLFKVYRYGDGALSEVTTNEYTVRDGYLELVTTNIAPIAIAKSKPIVFDGTGSNTVIWLATDFRRSAFAHFNLKFVGGDIDNLTDAAFYFEDRYDTNDVLMAQLWGGHQELKVANNHAATKRVKINGVTFRTVPMEHFLEAARNCAADGKFAYGVTDASLSAKKIVTDTPFAFPIPPAYTNELARQTEVEIMLYPTKTVRTLDDYAKLSGVMGFIGWKTGGQRATYLALASGDQGGVTNYEVIVTKLMTSVRSAASATPSLATLIPTAGPVVLSTSYLKRVRQSLAVNAVVDEGSDPYCEIVDFVMGDATISGQVEVGAGDTQGSLGRNATVTLLGATSAAGPWRDIQTITSVSSGGTFVFNRPSDCTFFKLRINVQDL